MNLLEVLGPPGLRSDWVAGRLSARTTCSLHLDPHGRWQIWDCSSVKRHQVCPSDHQAHGLHLKDGPASHTGSQYCWREHLADKYFTSSFNWRICAAPSACRSFARSAWSWSTCLNLLFQLCLGQSIFLIAASQWIGERGLVGCTAVLVVAWSVLWPAFTLQSCFLLPSCTLSQDWGCFPIHTLRKEPG